MGAHDYMGRGMEIIYEFDKSSPMELKSSILRTYFRPGPERMNAKQNWQFINVTTSFPELGVSVCICLVNGLGLCVAYIPALFYLCAQTRPANARTEATSKSSFSADNFRSRPTYPPAG